MLMQLEIRVRGNVAFNLKSGLYVSSGLDIVSQGRTEAEAKQALEDSVRLTLNYAFANYTFGDLLWRKYEVWSGERKKPAGPQDWDFVVKFAARPRGVKGPRRDA